MSVQGRRVDFVLNNDILELFSYALMMKVGKYVSSAENVY